MAATKGDFPVALRNKIPKMVFMLVGQKHFVIFFGIALCVLAMHGPIIGNLDHNGPRYLIAALLCPATCSLYFILRPFNPYRGFAARLERMVDADKLGSDEKRLVQLYRSNEARWFILQTTAKISGLLFSLMVILAWFERNSLNWVFPSSWTIPGVLGAVIGSHIVLGSEYIVWGLRTWADGEVG